MLSTFQRSNKDSDHSFRRNKPVHFGGSIDFLYCSYVKILGETNFHTREIPRSGSKAKDGEKERGETERW